MTELILRAKNGDSEAMNEIVKENVGLVWNIVKRFNNRGYELEDLFQIGSIGLIKAILRFDTNYDTKLSTYAVSMIIGEIKRFLRDDGIIKVSRSLKELAISINEVRKKNLDKDYTIEDLAKILEVEKDDIVMALDACSSLESLDKTISDEQNSRTIGETIEYKYNEYDILLNKMEINSLLAILDEKEKKVILYRYYKEMKQAEIANLLGTSQVQISRIEKRALEKMRMSHGGRPLNGTSLLKV